MFQRSNSHGLLATARTEHHRVPGTRPAEGNGHPQPPQDPVAAERPQGRFTRRTQRQSAPASLAGVGPVTSRTLALRHSPPPDSASQNELQRLALAQHLHERQAFLTSAKFQRVALGAVSAGAGLSTLGFAANLGDAGPWAPVASAIAAICAFADVGQAQVTTDKAVKGYLKDQLLLAEQQRLMADIQRREQLGQARPDDAAMKTLVATLIESLQGMTASFEAAYFRDTDSPHVAQLRHALHKQARDILELKAQHDELGDRIHRLSAELYIPGLDESQRTALIGRIERLQGHQAQLEANAQQLRREMKKVLSPKHMRRSLTERLATAQAELEQLRQHAWQRQVPHGPDLPGRLLALRAERRHVQLQRLQASRAWPGEPALDLTLLEYGEIGWLQPEILQALNQAIQSVADEPELVRLDAEIAQAEAWLQQEANDQNSIAQAQRDILALKKDLRHFGHLPDRLLITPLGIQGPMAMAHLRDAILNTLGNALSIAAAGNSASVLWQLVQASFSSINILIPAWLLNFLIAHIDIQGGKQNMKDAAAGKLPWIHTAAASSTLYLAYSRDERAEVRAARYPLQALAQRAAVELRFLHRLSQLGKTRKGNGLYTLVVSVGLVVGGAITLLTGVPTVLIPFALLGGMGGTAYAGTAAKFVHRVYIKEHAYEDRAAATTLFVQHFGVDAIGEFYADMAKGNTALWTQRLRALRGQLSKSTPGRQLLHPQLLAGNEAMAIEHLSQALQLHWRDPQHPAARIGAELVSRMAEARQMPDPGSLKPQAFASPERYMAQVRQSLKNLYAVEPNITDAPPFRNKRALKKAAALLNDCLSLAEQKGLDGAPAGAGQATLSSWIRQLAQQPDQFGAQLAALSEPEREELRRQLAYLRQVLRLQGVGPRQLYALQALSVMPAQAGKPHPLGEFPPLASAHAPYLMELLADPSWMEATDAQPLPAPDPSLSGDGGSATPPAPTGPSGPELLARLSQAHKQVGRDLRDGPAVSKPRLPREPEDLLAPPRHRRHVARVTRAAVAAGQSVKKWGPAVAKHVAQHLPNQLATPGDTMRTLEKTKDPVKRQLLLQNILLNFVGGPDFVLPQNPEVMSQLPVGATPTEVRRAHLQAWLASAADSANTTATAIGNMPTSKTRPEMKQLGKRMTDQSALCTQLSGYLADPTLAWDASLAAIQVQPPIAVA